MFTTSLKHLKFNILIAYECFWEGCQQNTMDSFFYPLEKVKDDEDVKRITVPDTSQHANWQDVPM